MSRQHKGVYIAIEGGDGSGKGTQTKVLVDKLKKLGFDVVAMRYPQYGKPSARYVERYLRGEYGQANDVPADLASLAYALDRADADTLSTLRNHLAKPNGIVISDRSPASNMAHQGTKISSLKKRQQFYREMVELEYEVLREPRPDLNIVLRADATTAQANVDRKDADTHGYTTAKRDIHEADTNHLTLALRNYDELCEILPEEFIPINALDDAGKMRPIEEVHQQIMTLIQGRRLLPGLQDDNANTQKF